MVDGHEMVTVAQVEGRLAEVRRLAEIDDESAHVEQDRLLVSVLQAIADGRVKPTMARHVAREALKVEEIEFSRWYA